MERHPVVLALAAVSVLLLGISSALSYEEPLTRAAPLGPPPVVQPGSTTTFPTSQSYDGEVRDVVLHVPDGLLAPAPLVLVLHARSQGPEAIRAYSRFERLADRQGFVVAFPDGAAGSWNAGACCFPASEDGVDDVAYLDEVLRLVRERVAIDPARVSISGGSNGGMMALRYACERPAVVASVAVVSAPFVATCSPARPVPVLVLHGEQDGVVPLRGGRNAQLRTDFPDVARSLEPFRAAGGEVELRVVPTAGHDWMTLDRHGVDATIVLWDWMRDHPRPL